MRRLITRGDRRCANCVEVVLGRWQNGVMTRRGPRSVPVLLFVFLALLDLMLVFPRAELVLEPAAALALLGAVTAAVVHVAGTRPGPWSGCIPSDGEADGGNIPASSPVIPVPRREEAVTRSRR
jgi:hypothetical protein